MMKLVPIKNLAGATIRTGPVSRLDRAVQRDRRTGEKTVLCYRKVVKGSKFGKPSHFTRVEM